MFEGFLEGNTLHPSPVRGVVVGPGSGIMLPRLTNRTSELPEAFKASVPILEASLSNL
jgi:hypothetical protein